MTDLTGHELGRYHLLEKLGEGGMAIVYKAYDTRLETEVAVKFIKAENLPQSSVERALKRFEREAKALARLTHPNIVKVTDYGEYRDRPYLVMPYLPGGTLKTKLGKPIPWQEAVELILPVADALAYAHSQHVIHRDVKPANIILTQSGRPMLTDFGIAKLLDLEDTVDLTGTNAAVGTPEYMAPEQANAKSVDRRADIYSLGIVLYEMVTGRKPFVADTPMTVLIMQARDPLPSPRKFAPSLSDRAEKILLKALAKRPEKRYQTMDEFYSALASRLTAPAEIRLPVESVFDLPKPFESEPFLHMPPISQPHPKSKRSWGIAGISAALVCLVIGALIAFRSLSPVSSAVTSVPITQTPAFGVGSAWTSSLQTGSVTMLYVPAGNFKMGSNDGSDDEKPIHTVYLNAYWMDRAEVTNAMYRICVNAGVCLPPSNIGSYARSNYYDAPEFDDYPVIHVDWNQSKTYCEWRGDGTRLPTEAEWEKAARGMDGRVYPWGSEWDINSMRRLNFSDRNDPSELSDIVADDGYGDTAPVGSYLDGASPYGLYDMAGNVWEWVADWYSETYYQTSPFENPLGPDTGQDRVLRGGSWDVSGDNIRITDREGYDPYDSYDHIGFRCARSLP
jgi:serine/threonine protein kinase